MRKTLTMIYEVEVEGYEPALEASLKHVMEQWKFGEVVSITIENTEDKWFNILVNEYGEKSTFHWKALDEEEAMKEFIQWMRGGGTKFEILGIAEDKEKK